MMLVTSVAVEQFV